MRPKSLLAMQLLSRTGSDAAFRQAERNAEEGGRPTVILAKTLKGFGLETIVGRNT